MTLKERLKRDSLRPPSKKGLLSFIQRKLFPRKDSGERYLSLFLTTRCNLECFSCAALGMNPVRMDTRTDDVFDFIHNLRGYRMGSTVMLTGGEPTLLNKDKLKKICDILHNYRYKVSMLTNGAVQVPPEWFDFIFLDRHGVNDVEIDGWIELLENSDTPYDVHQKQEHQDIRYAMDDNITKGARCANWLKPLTLWGNTVYPCCNLMCVQWWNNDNVVQPALIKAGWTSSNPDLVDTVLNWRETMPPEVFKLCQLGCWKDADKAKWAEIK